MLKRCVLTTWGGCNSEDREAQELFDRAGLFVEGTNTYVLFLSPEGQVVHSIPSPKFPKPQGRNPMYFHDEIVRGLSMAGLPASEGKWVSTYEELNLPDVKGQGSPAGFRLYLRSEHSGSSSVIVEAVPLEPELSKSFAYTGQAKNVEAEVLKSLLIQLYPAGIRSFEQQMSFKQATGTLQLVPAGSDSTLRYAVLKGSFCLIRQENESSSNGSLELVLTYGLNGPDVRSLRGVAKATYDYRPHGREEGEVRLTAAIESRPK